MERLHAEGLHHNGKLITYGDGLFCVDFTEHTGTLILIYGQTEVTRDLYAAREACGGSIYFNVEHVVIRGADAETLHAIYLVDGEEHHLECGFIAGCDGFHGVSRQTVPSDVRRGYEKVYPFGWLGILSEILPVDYELIYANSPRGFAFCSMRNENLSRYYVQCSLSDKPEDWTDEAFRQEHKRRIPKGQAEKLVTGPSIEKSIAPLRGVATGLTRWGCLFLCGRCSPYRAVHRRQRLNTAASDVHYLYNGLRDYCENASSAGINSYSDKALECASKTERFS